MNGRLLDVGRAVVGHAADGTVTFDDPRCPWRVRITTTPAGRVRRLRVDVRAGAEPITASTLGRLPLGQMAAVAARLTQPQHPNELYYQLLAQPKPPGARSWPDEHWQRVLMVHDWGVRTGRPGGGLQAVADLWGVSAYPTAKRWLAQARAAG